MKAILFISLFLTTFVFSQDKMNMNLLFNWNDPSISSSSLIDNRYNEIWGYYQNGKEYAIIGSTLGTHFFDITDPQNSQQVDFVQGRDTGTAIIHRDYHTYNNYLYAVSDEGNASLQIIDLSYLPDSVSIVYDSDLAIKRSHNIFIDTASARLYSCGTARFEIYDISNPINPSLIIKCNFNIQWWNQIINAGSGYVHDLYVKNDTAFCNAGNGLFVVDFTDALNPVLLGSITTYPHEGYNHSGWLSEDGKTYILGDETWGKKVKILDVTNLNDIQFIDTIGSDIHPESLPHNIIIKDNYIYVSYFFDGVYIWDISSPQNPTLVGYYDTSNEPHVDGDYKGSWGVYPFLPSGVLIASDMQEGLFVFDVTQAISSINSIENENTFKVFPNPTKDNISLLGTKNFGKEYMLTLMDLSGKTIFSKTFKNTFLSKENISLPSELTSGTYVLNIQGENYNQSQRIIKE